MQDPDNVEEEDEIVREIDVFCSPTLASQLHLIQFPLQHNPVPLPTQARIRTKHGIMLELDQTLPNNIGRDGAYFLQERTHVSQTIPVSTHLTLGKMQNGELHLVPLEHISQMRPSFSHVDESTTTVDEDAAQPATTAQLDAALSSSTSNERKPLMFKKKESERATLARQSSHAYKIACQESEDWQILHVHGRDSAEYKQLHQQVVQSGKNDRVALCGNAASFVKSLNYLPPLQGHGDLASCTELPVSSSSTDGRLQSQQQVSSRLVQKLTTLMKRGCPMPYCVLRPQFPDTADANLLEALASCAVLVRGNFCLHSRYLPLAPNVAQARTLVLYLFHTFGYVQQSRLNQVFYKEDTTASTVTPEWIELLLKQVGEKSLNGWKLKLEDNHAFCEAFPEQATLHQQYWERQSTRLAESIKLYLA